MKRISCILAVIAVALASVVHANTQHYKITVADFHHLVVVDGVNVEYVCDPSRAGLIEFDASKELASSVIFEPGNGKLSIQLMQRDNPLRGLPTIRVYSSYLTKVSNEGDSLLHVLSIAPQGKLNARVVGNGRLMIDSLQVTSLDATVLTGNGTITLSGVASNAKLSVAGTGHIEAGALYTDVAACSITGTGSIEVRAAKTLKASGVGTGKIRYIGSPEIKKGFLSTVKLIPIDGR